MSERPSPSRPSNRLRTALSSPTVLTVLLALFAGALVFLIASEVFPYHSSNDDEGVYLQQAASLLDGQLRMYTEIPYAFRPWFFVVDGNALYSKYTPVAAAIFALGMAVDLPRLSLAAVTVANVVLVSLLAREAFDARTGVLAAAVLTATPFFVINSALFLPYAPTTLFNLVFALGYVRAIRRRSLPYATLAGLAIGIAFFSRSYTAVLFAVPFVAHALYRLAVVLRAHDGGALARAVRQYAVLGACGLAFVGVTLAYNGAMTGDPLTFPYEAFAPNDGLGFGEREILAYDRNYTPELALIANSQVVWEFATRWTAAAPIGAVLAAVGVGAHLRAIEATARVRALSDRVVDRLTDDSSPTDRRSDRDPSVATAGNGGSSDRRSPFASVGRVRDSLVRARSGSFRRTLRRATKRVRVGVGSVSRSFAAGRGTVDDGLPDRTVRTLLAGLFVSVIGGNVYFWGNLNILGGVYNPTDGLIALYGPFYHFDLLLPLSVFGASGLLRVLWWLRDRLGTVLPAADARTVVLVLVALSIPFAAVAQANALDAPLGQHANNTDQFERAYQPLESRDFENALVFLPPIYGGWLNHPFQYLRNDPSLRGEVVYALERSPGGDFTVIDAYPNRTLYRYTFHGGWPAEENVTSRLQRLAVREGARHRITTEVGVPANATVSTVRLESNDQAVQYALADRSEDTVTVEWVFGAENGRVVADRGLERLSDNSTVELHRSERLSLELTFLRSYGPPVTYHYELFVSVENGLVRVIWPPRIEACRSMNCGYADTYLPGAGDYPDGVSANATIETTG